VVAMVVEAAEQQMAVDMTAEQRMAGALVAASLAEAVLEVAAWGYERQFRRDYLVGRRLQVGGGNETHRARDFQTCPSAASKYQD